MSPTQCENGACARCHPENKQNGECYLRSPTQPSEQRECKDCQCHCEKTDLEHTHFTRGCDHCTVKTNAEPSPEQEKKYTVKEVLASLYWEEVDADGDADGFIHLTSDIAGHGTKIDIKNLVRSIQAKSYEAGQRETIDKIFSAAHFDLSCRSCEEMETILKSLHLPPEESKK